MAPPVFSLEDRLARFAAEVMRYTKTWPNDRTGKTLKDQMQRSSLSSALNYGEAQGTETGKDFIHKMSLVVKEWKETRVATSASQLRCSIRIISAALAVPVQFSAYRTLRYTGVIADFAHPIFETFEHFNFISLRRGKLWHNSKFGDPKLARLFSSLSHLTAHFFVAFET